MRSRARCVGRDVAERSRASPTPRTAVARRRPHRARDRVARRRSSTNDDVGPGAHICGGRRLPARSARDADGAGRARARVRRFARRRAQGSRRSAAPDRRRRDRRSTTSPASWANSSPAGAPDASRRTASRSSSRSAWRSRTSSPRSSPSSARVPPASAGRSTCDERHAASCLCRPRRDDDRDRRSEPCRLTPTDACGDSGRPRRPR